MKNQMKLLREKCIEHGLKVTPQRELIYKCLCQADDHPSTELLYKRVREVFPNISLDTVSRTLTTFSQIGLVFVVEGSGDVRRYDARKDNHQHFKCVKCKKIIDFEHELLDDVKIPAGFGDKNKVLRKAVYFEGVCEKCLGSKGANTKKNSK